MCIGEYHHTWPLVDPGVVTGLHGGRISGWCSLDIHCCERLSPCATLQFFALIGSGHDRYNVNNYCTGDVNCKLY